MNKDTVMKYLDTHLDGSETARRVTYFVKWLIENDQLNKAKIAHLEEAIVTRFLRDNTPEREGEG